MKQKNSPNSGHNKLIDEGQAGDYARPDQVQRHQKGPARQAFSNRRRHRGERHIGHHLDRQRRAQHCARIVARQLPRQKPERHRRQPRAEQCHKLGCEEVAKGRVAEGLEHRATTTVRWN